MSFFFSARASRAAVAFGVAPPHAFSPRVISSALRCAAGRPGAAPYNACCASLPPCGLTYRSGRLARAPRLALRPSPKPRLSTKQPIYAFEKVPTTQPDWWNDDDDDEDGLDDFNKLRLESAGSQVALASGSGSGSLARNGGGGGGGRDDSGKFSGDGDGSNKGLFAMIVAMYLRAMSRNPILTKAAITCVIACLGDLLAQTLSHIGTADAQWDVRRTLAISTWALCFMGPALHFWFGTLDRLFTSRYSVLCKLLTDQLLFAPFFNSAFMMGVGTLEGHSFKDNSQTVKTKLWTAMKANWMLWPAAQFVNFSFVPKNFQVVYVNCVALVWNVIFMYISHAEPAAVA